jgi:hypothetical protein
MKIQAPDFEQFNQILSPMTLEPHVHTRKTLFVGMHPLVGRVLLIQGDGVDDCAVVTDNEIPDDLLEQACTWPDDVSDEAPE